MRAIVLGLFASIFFSTTFVLNRAMDLDGGHWIWSGALRYFFMVPFLLVFVLVRRNLRPLLQDLLRRPWLWIRWGTVGFGLFYAPLCLAAAYGPSWLLAGTFQITIIAGSLLVPLFYERVDTPNGPLLRRQKIPFRGLGFSLIILLGIVLVQADQARALSWHDLLFGLIPVLIGAFAYPLGNRKMMTQLDGKFDTFQRTLGMTLGSIPFWLLLSAFGLADAGLPSAGQVGQSLVVALCSGVVATLLFFYATDLAKGNPQRLSAVEATQSGEVVFTTLGEMLLLGTAWPSPLALGGLFTVVVGMVLHSFSARAKPKPKPQTPPLQPLDKAN
ncbi:MAG TPA: multidrug resistance efflux transporter family protein [Bacilli bacterium]|nr:multidrug resistance efflux transporter family protein [Bacilli bacterium]